ncbi:MAG: FkbM family methyltransferase [Alphaproteobacteria bacterium]|nr:FkbM family methyltransferase [Alphaproteobacteria bacterium]
MESLIGKLKRHRRDVRDFGPAVLGRIFRKPDKNRSVVVSTRYGRFFIRRFDTDLDVLRQVFVDRQYDLDRFPQGKTIRAQYEDMLGRGQTPLIIDAGAHAGFASRFFAEAYPGARILAVEPDHHNAALCCANTASQPQIEVIEAAIGSRPGHVSIDRGDGHSWGVRTERSDAGQPIVTIGELRSRVTDSALLIVKVDIEGFEADLFSDATEWVAETDALIVEPHDWMLPRAGSSQALQRVMLRQGRELLVSGDTVIWTRASPTAQRAPRPGPSSPDRDR